MYKYVLICILFIWDIYLKILNKFNFNLFSFKYINYKIILLHKISQLYKKKLIKLKSKIKKTNFIRYINLKDMCISIVIIRKQGFVY